MAKVEFQDKQEWSREYNVYSFSIGKNIITWVWSPWSWKSHKRKYLITNNSGVDELWSCLILGPLSIHRKTKEK